MGPRGEAAKKDEKPPVLLIGGGFSNLMAARYLQREGVPFIIYDRLDKLGGVWLTIGNDTSKVQTEHGTYSGLFDGEGKPDHSGECYPSRRMVVQFALSLCRKHGLDLQARCSHEIIRVVPDGDYYQARAKNLLTGEVSDVRCRGSICAPGFFPTANRVSWPGEETFAGHTCYGVAKDMDSKYWRNARCIIIGHGAFAIENIRTATECGAMKATIVSKRHSVVIPRECGFVLNFLPDMLPVRKGMEMMQPMYYLLGMNTFKDLPTIAWTPDGAGIMTQRNPPLSDLYFLAQYAGFCEQVDDSPKSINRDSMTMESGRMIECSVIVKSLGADLTGRGQIDDVFGIKIINGFFINTDPNHLVYITSSRSYGVRSFGPTSNTLPMVSVLISWLHFQEFPQDFYDIYEAFPTLTSLSQSAGILSALSTLATIPRVAERFGLVTELRISKMRECYEDGLSNAMRTMDKEWEEWKSIPGGEEFFGYVREGKLGTAR